MNRLKTILISATMALVVSAPAYARHGGEHGPGPDPHPHFEHGIEEARQFDDGRRERIRAYMREDMDRRCPYGLAKKHRCRRPTHSVTYQIGGYVPVRHRDLPADFVTRMGPPPRGMYYAMVDNDVLLVSMATKKIIDAITLMSVVGN
ncbi:MAG: hypothetical protein PHW76_01830 [Alphaproteobacteria bacterium]|nr:hypothetical protein [Alphaproteobacteria bacterium]